MNIITIEEYKCAKNKFGKYAFHPHFYAMTGNESSDPL
jgi:hypothetical protein